MPSFTIIVPVFNRPGYTKACLDSIVGTSAEVVVVDNHSRGDVRRLLDSYGPRIKVVRNGANLGIAKALNQGIRESSHDRLVMLHNDCIVAPDFERDVDAAFEAMHGKYKLASPMTNYSDESTFVLSHELQAEFVSIKPSNKLDPSHEEVMALVERAYARHGGMAVVAAGVSGEVQPAGEISSFCLLAFKDALLNGGAFNESFMFRRWEDKELFLRLDRGQAGAKAPFFVHHFGNVTSDGPGFSFQDLNRRNEEIFQRVRREWLDSQGGGGPKPWAAVLFPERNFPELAARARASLEAMNVPPSQIVEIPYPGIYPIKAAWDWALARVRYEILGMVDADMVLNNDAAEPLLAPFSDPNVGMAAARLDDSVAGLMSNPVFWRTSVLRRVIASPPPAIDYEIHFQAEVRRMGLDVAWVEDVVGRHAPHLDPWSIFRAFFRRGIKQRIRGLGKPMAYEEIRGAVENGGPWSHIAMVGFHAGIAVDYGGDPHDEAFDALTTRHYELVRPFCETIAATADQTEFFNPPEPDGRVRVALLCECLEIGGMEMIIAILDRLVDRSRFDVRVYSRLGGALAPLLRSEVRIAGGQRGTIGRRVADWLLRDGIEVAVSMSFWGADDIFSRGKPCRFIERMDAEPYGYVKQQGVTDVAVFESETMFARLSPDYPCRNKVIVPNGREPFSPSEEDRRRVRGELEIPEGFVVVANIARMHECKNQRDQILMAGELVKRGVKGFRLVIMGPDQGARGGLERLVVDMGLERWVSIIEGTVAKVPGMLSASDIAINTSPSEGLCGSLVEALHAGLPIVATDVGATKDIVSSVNGALVPYGDVGALADAIVPLIVESSTRLRAGEASKALSKRYSAAEMVGGFERLIGEQAMLHRIERAKAPFATIVMPIWRRHQHFDAAIKSVLAQDDIGWAMIVAIDDDEPSPEVMAILEGNRDPRISWVKSPHKNQCSAINHAMRYVRSPWAIRLDSDDAITPDAIGVMRAQIGANPDVGFFYTERTYIDGDGRDVSERYPGAGVAEDFSPLRMEEWYIARALCAWRVSEFVRAGGFDEEITYGEDYLLPLTMMLHGTKLMAVKRPLYQYRMHGDGNVSAIPTPEQDAFVNAVRARYQRLKGALGVSWAGEDPSTMMPRSWRPTIAQDKKI